MTSQGRYDSLQRWTARGFVSIRFCLPLTCRFHLTRLRAILFFVFLALLVLILQLKGESTLLTVQLTEQRFLADSSGSSRDPRPALSASNEGQYGLRHSPEQAVINGQSPVTDAKSPMTDRKSPMTYGKSPVTDAKSPVTDGKSPVIDEKSPVTDGKSPMTDGKSPMTDGKSPITDVKSPMTDVKSPITDVKSPMTDVKSPVTDGKSPMTDAKSLVTDGKSPVIDEKSPVTDGKSPMTDGKSPMTDGKSPITDVKSPMTDVKSPITNVKSPMTDVKSPVTDGKSPMTDVKSPVTEIFTKTLQSTSKDVGASQAKVRSSVQTRSSRQEQNVTAVTSVTSAKEGGSKEQYHVFFLKVHKAASTTVMNVLYRFALKRHLNVMLPRHDNVLSEYSKFWAQNAVPLPPIVPHFDILCNHLIFNEPLIRNSLYPDAKFIAIVRDPLSQFVSAFKYYSTTYRVPYLSRIPGPNALQTYMKNPKKWEHVNLTFSFTHNRMSLDFGMNRRGLMGSQQHIAEYVNYLNKTFDLVLVSERFDESMVMLKRLLGWRLRDILYIKNNVFKDQQAAGKNTMPLGARTKNHNITTEKHQNFKGQALTPPAKPVNKTFGEHHFTQYEKRLHAKFNAADYALYSHFSTLFQKRVEAEGKAFAEEVKVYKDLLKQVSSFCVDSQKKGLTLGATKYSDSFRLVRLECQLMTTPELDLVEIQRREQQKRSREMMRRA